ncbi:MAG: sulfite exporter TauE/SafE family protein [Myxococcota bacterium]
MPTADIPVQLSLLALAGLLAGYINSVAGAGSLLTLPALIFTGLDAGSANATNRVAVLFQNAAAMVAFHRSGRGAIRHALVLAIPAGAAAVAGTVVASLTPDDVLRLCIAVAMVVFLVLSLVPRPAPTAPAGDATEARRPDAKTVLAFVAIGFYAGFLQAGVGILLLLYMSLVQRMHLVFANGIKVVVILLLAAVALVTFAWQGVAIDALRGLVLAVATTTGGYLGAMATIRRGEKFVRGVLFVAVAGSVVKLAWDTFA